MPRASSKSATLSEEPDVSYVSKHNCAVVPECVERPGDLHAQGFTHEAKQNGSIVQVCMAEKRTLP